MQIVWFKRDLRIHDHAPLRTAVQDCLKHGPVLCLYIHELSMAARADCARQHTEFARECLAELSLDIERLGGHLVQVVGEAPAIFEQLHQAAKDHACLAITRILSHEETTTMDGFARDLAVGAWARSAGVIFHEVAQNAVERGSRLEKNGHDFKGHVNRALSTEGFGVEAVVAAAHAAGGDGGVWVDGASEFTVATLKHIKHIKHLKEAEGLTQLPGLPEFPVGQGADKPRRLKGGRSAALAQLTKFADLDKLMAYPGAISSPNTAAAGCSRLSPYLTLGVVSDREVLFHLQRAGMAVTQESSADPAASKKRARAVENGMQFFAQRLYWRAGYLQLMESYPKLEIEPEVTTLLAAREPTRGYSEYAAHHRFEQWALGRTGVPMIDAAMRLLKATGWANFRLRGAVTSFALNELWLPWHQVAQHLAREFLDFEPAIHYSQVAIHGGLLKGSRPLIYSAVKQARDHDANGEFVRAWIPELSMVPLDYLFEPWTMPQAVQDRSGCQLGTDYPLPLVDVGAAHTCAKTRVYALWQGEADSGGEPHLARPAQVDDENGEIAGNSEGPPARKARASKAAPKEDQLALF